MNRSSRTQPRSLSDLLEDPRAPLLILGLAVLSSAALLLELDSHLTFIADDWMLLVKRWGSGAATFLHPFHGNIVLAPALTYRLLRALFGMGSSLPYYIVSISVFLTSAVLLFTYVRRRVGDWLALLTAILILFLGAAFEDLLFAFQIGYFGSVATGIGMLIALDREDERGDRIACALIVISLSFSSVGIAFAAAALTDIFLGRRPRSSRAYVALAPLLLYALWWAGWGHAAQNHLSLESLEKTPKFVFDAASAGITSLLGLATGDGSEPNQPHLIWGKVVLVGAGILTALRIHREGRISRGMAVALALSLTFWGITGLNRNLERFPTSSRYQYVSAICILVIAAEALRGVRLPRLAMVTLTVVTGLAVWGGVSLMYREYSQRWKPYADSLRSSLAAVQIAGSESEPRYEVSFSHDLSVPARTYLSVVREHGSPAFSEAQLANRPESERAIADVTLAQALGLALKPPSPRARILRCQTLDATAEGATGITLLRGGFTLTNRAATDVDVKVGRFAGGLPVSLGSLNAGSRAALAIPIDHSTRPWDLGLVGEGPVRLCTTTQA